METWTRTKDILGALRDQQENRASEALKSLAAAERRWHDASQTYEALAERLVAIPAKTIDDAFVKARIMRRKFLDDGMDSPESFNVALRKHMRTPGPDAEACALSLARDLIQLAESGPCGGLKT